MITNENLDKALTYNTQISKLFRENLTSTIRPLVSLEAELLWLKKYLDAESLLYDRVFSYNINISKINPSDYSLPPMILQPIITNSIINGFVPERKERKGHLEITAIEVSDSSFEITIEDDAIVKAGAAGSIEQELVFGLASIKSRINLINLQGKIAITFTEISPIQNNRGSRIKLYFIKKMEYE